MYQVTDFGEFVSAAIHVRRRILVRRGYMY
jgi:hypothetical protein